MDHSQERDDAILLIEEILKKHRSHRPTVIYNAIRDAFRGNEPLHADFDKEYRAGITASELFDSLYPKTCPPSRTKKRPLKAENAKHGRRRDPLEVKQPNVTKKNWLGEYEDPAIVFTDPGSRGDVHLCDMMNDEARRRYEASGNMLFVLEAFFRRVDILCGKLSEPQVRDAKPKKREYRLDDGGGLCLLITPDGSKQWHIGDHCFADYTFPERSLSYARRYYLAWRDLVSKGKYPATEEYEREIEARIDCLYDNEPDVPIPAWMAQALTDAFKQHYSRNFLHHKNTTLDDILGISGKKYREEFDIFTIDDRTLVDKAREVQWTCNLAFATACKHAKRILELDSSARGDNIDRKATYPLLRTVRERESRGDYGDLSAWCNGKSYAPLVNHYIRESFLELMDMIDPQLRLEIENDMKDVRKRWLKF